MTREKQEARWFTVRVKRAEHTQAVHALYAGIRGPFVQVGEGQYVEDNTVWEFPVEAYGDASVVTQQLSEHGVTWCNVRPRQPTACEIADKLVEDMGYDNGVAFKPTADQHDLLVRGVRAMQAAGMQFTDEEVDELVAGERMDVIKRFAHIQGFDMLDEALEAIFETPEA